MTLRMDSPWPVQEAAPLMLSAYPPEPDLQEKQEKGQCLFKIISHRGVPKLYCDRTEQK